MTLFHRWRTSFDEPKQITWVCGEAIVLVEEVVATIRATIAPEPWNLVTLNANDTSVRTLHNELAQHPLDTGRRLIVLRHVDVITDWSFLLEWIPKRFQNPKTYLVLVSDEAKLPRFEKELPDYLDLISKRGSIVECRPFTNATAKYSVPWVKSLVPMRENVARYLMERANFDITLVRDTCIKLKMLGLREITLSHVAQLLPEQPRDTFVDALVQRDIETALMALERVPSTDIGRVIGQLDARLDLAGMVHDMIAEHKSPGEMARAAGPQAFLIPEIRKVAKNYDSVRRLEIRKALAVADAAWRRGQNVGVLEAVVAFW